MYARGFMSLRHEHSYASMCTACSKCADAAFIACRAVSVLRHLTYVSPNAAECVAMAAAVRRKRRNGSAAGGEAVTATAGLHQYGFIIRQ